MFAQQGFERTTVDDIAAAAGIGRRTFFRYFASKNDLVWGDFQAHLAWLEQLLAAAAPSLPMMDALRAAIVEFNRYDPADVPWHRQRMELILNTPTLQADATLRYAAWRRIVTAFAARRTGLPPSDMLPRLIGHAALGAALSAYATWLAGPGFGSVRSAGHGGTPARSGLRHVGRPGRRRIALSADPGGLRAL
ncbi:mycofactocin system transcriptional regulator [Streptomyces sp. NPDC020792]|uniref:mycofactocin system transcriptional regulator n=1 Tax=Streptomyces sp. NPDC020792 TaxID=3365089 RepID=UPI0037A7559D